MAVTRDKSYFFFLSAFSIKLVRKFIIIPQIADVILVKLGESRNKKIRSSSVDLVRLKFVQTFFELF